MKPESLYQRVRLGPRIKPGAQHQARSQMIRVPITLSASRHCDTILLLTTLP